MKPWLKFFLGAALALAGVTMARAQSLSPTGITATPGSVLPGDTVSFVVTVNNGATVQFGPGATGSFTVVLTHLVTGATFTIGPVTAAPTSGIIGKATVDPTTGQTTPGTGTFTLPAVAVPINTTEAGNYRASVTLNSVTAGTVGTATFAVSSSALTVTGKPDLQITALSYAASTSYVGGTVIPMSVTYRNNSSTNGTSNVPYIPGINGFPVFVRIQVVLSANPTFGDADDFQLTINDISAGNFGTGNTTDNAGNSALMADNSTHTFSWNQVLPGNFSGSYYVLAKIDSLNVLPQNDPPVLTVNGNNVWGGNTLNPSGTLINLLPTNFPTVGLASHGAGVATSAMGYSDNPSISSDGRYVAFASDAADLVANDTNAARDIFLFDSQTSLVRLLSKSQQGTQGNAASNNPALSASGRYVAFASDASNLVIGDTNGFSDIFVVDTGTTTSTGGLISRVSVTTAGAQANNPSFRPAISSTGRYIVFESTATNLDANYTLSAAGGVSHIYLRDRDVSGSGTFDTPGNVSTKLVDADATTPASVAGNAGAIQAAISSDGTMIAWASKATNLAPTATTASRQHVYVRPTANVGTATSGTKLLSVATGTTTEGNADSQTPSLTANGNWVAFASLATNLVAGDTNGVSDIFVYDTTSAVATPTVRRVSLTNGGAQGTDPSAAGFQLGSINPTISSDGRYVAFASLDSNLTAGDINGQSQATDSNAALDIFVRDRDSTVSGTFDTVAATTQMVSVNPFGYQTNGVAGVPSAAASNIYPVISANGRFVAFPSDAEYKGGLAFGATNLLPLDNNRLRDVFLFDRRTNASVTAATPPTVTITNPGNGATALVNTPISVTASATTTVGVVASVQFFVNGTSLGVPSTVFPYSASWMPTAVGTYTLSALVTDSLGNIGVSTNVTVTINAAPSVGITAPVGGASIVVGTVTTVRATAAASNPGAFINTVQFFANGASLGTVTAPASSVSFTPSVSWTPAATGNVTLTAVAIDSIGTQITSSSVAVKIFATGGGGGGGPLSSPPTVSLSPAPPATASVNTPITLNASATASTGFTLTNVQYFANGVSIGSSSVYPYSVKWTPTAIGTYSITAVATDNVGTTATSAAASVVVSAGAAPTIALVSPNSGAAYAVGSPIALSASTSLGAGLIASVDFFANNVAIGSKTVSASGQGGAPFFNLEWSPAAAGTYVFYAVVTDTSGNRTVSTSVTVTVASVAAPTLTITSPTTGTTLTVNQTQTITAAATAGTGASITSVAFTANGASIGTSKTFPYSTSWTPTAPGTYTLRAVAIDSFGTQTTSSTVSVTVGAGSSSLPFVYLTSTPTGTNVTANTPVFVAANAGDPDGKVTNVEFYANGALIGSKATAPYFTLWTPTAATTYSITAVVTDDAGNRVTSTASTVTALVQVGVVPVANLAFNDPSVDTPTGGATPTSAAPFTPVKVNYGSKLIIAAQAISQDGSIAGVQFFANGTSIATVSAAPYYTTYQLNTLSDVVLTAIATDSSGNAVYTVPILINTQPSTLAAGAVVSLVTPLDGASYVAGGPIIFSATHNFGTVTPPKIDFYVNGSQFTTVSAAPYQANLGLTRAGVYYIHAVGRSGNTTTVSSVARITVTSAIAPTVSIRTPASGGSYVVGTSVTISADAASVSGTIQNVQFFVNGAAISTATTAPYVATWNPSSPGIYTLSATATDNAGNQTLSSPVTVTYTGNMPPSVSLSTPSVGARVVAGSAVSLVAAASDVDGTVTNVRFLANGVVVGSGSSAPFTATWTPTASGIYSVIAQATDNSGNVSSSTPVAVSVIASRPPLISLSSPASGTVLSAGASTGLVATATVTDSAIVKVQFLANGNAVGSAAAAPYSATWTPGTAGAYSVVAQAIDSVGNIASSTAVTVTVLPNQLPIVSLTSPANGAVVRAGTSTTLSASASDPDGSIAGVQFFVNGVSLGAPITTVTMNGYRMQWTPTAEGIYTITATATDNSGAAVSTTSTVLAVSASSGGDAVFTGTLFPFTSDQAQFAIINVGRKSAAFIGYSTPNGGKVYFYPSIPVSASGNFSLTDSGRVVIAGKFDVNDTSVTITTLDGASTTQIGIASFTGSGSATGYYTGSLSGRSASQLAAIVGPDGAIMLVATDGTARTAGAGFVDSAGVFQNISALGGGAFTGKIDPVTKFLSGNLTGPLAGGLMGARESGVAFSDGFLRNLSSRGQVGTGTNVLVAGFVVGGTVPKQVLIRAIGPSLTQFGITGALADPQLQLFGGAGGSVLVASNDNWGGGAALTTASNSVGAFPLSASSLDAVVLAALAPGNYTAQVSGVNGATGTALVELYDVDNPTPFSAQKVINISTRAIVGTGQNRLIAGFVVNGSTAKKVLIRAVGPTLGAAPFNVPGVLADPVLRLIRNSDNLVVRENDNWEVGNDAALVSDAAVKTGAFALAIGGQDAAILISLPPGSYSAEVTGAGTTTGIALVEVYEVP